MHENSMGDIEELSQKDIPRVFYNGFYRGDLNLITAQGGTGKTYLALQLAVSYATGQVLIPPFRPRGRGRVALFLGEDGQVPIAQRLKAIAKVCDVPLADIQQAIDSKHLWIITAQASALATYGNDRAANSPAYKTIVKELAQDYDMIVVDPWLAWSGLGNENDNAVANQAANVAISLAKETDAAVVFLHHVAKGSGVPGAGQSGRGASALSDAARFIINLVRFSLSTNDKEKEEQLRKWVKLTFEKNSYGALSEPIYLSREDGGALALMDYEAAKNEPHLKAVNKLADAMYTCFTDAENGKTDDQLAKRKDGEELRERLQEACGDDIATAQNIMEALRVAAGEKGCLEIRSRKANKRQVSGYFIKGQGQLPTL
jgi:RecA-family ATPase